MAVTDPDKVATKQDLADLYQGMLPYLGGNLPVMGQINKSDIYSTTEKVVGCYTDGRPLYQRTYIGTFPSTSGGNISGNLFAFSYDVKNVGGYIRLTSGGTIPSINTDVGYVYQSNGYIICYYTNTAYANATYNITLQYTKSTDAANSFNYASENDYSTSETIIGTWYDGQKIYQKVITGTLNSSGTTTATTLPIAYNVIGYKGYLKKGTYKFPVFGTTCSGSFTCEIVVALMCGSTYWEVVVNGNNTYYRGGNYYIAVQYTKS